MRRDNNHPNLCGYAASLDPEGEVRFHPYVGNLDSILEAWSRNIRNSTPCIVYSVVLVMISQWLNNNK